MSDLISANAVSVYRDNRSVLRDITLKIKEHDFMTIIGPNGAGKSMLLKCLIGFYEPDQGSVTRKNDLKIGYVPQRLVTDALIPISVSQFIKLRKKASADKFVSVVKETGIGNYLDQPIDSLSGGEMQRVLLARALLDEPELLVLDEPAQNLDITGQLAFYKLIETIYNDRNISILMVSHDLHLVMSATKNVVCLSGEISCQGAPSSVAQDPAFITLFGEDMANMMASYHHHDHSHHHHHDHEHEHTG